MSRDDPARPTAAKGVFPYLFHRTLAEVEADSAAVPALPPEGVWVAAHWPHMVNTGGSLSRFGGWFPSRRYGGVWQAKFGSYFARAVAGHPSRWNFGDIPNEDRKAIDEGRGA